MIQVRHKLLILSVGVVASATVLGCRRTEPLDAQSKDLASDEASLVPMISVWADPSVSEGKADWLPFREPVFDTAGAGDREAVAGGGDSVPSARATQIEADLRALIDEYHSLLDGEKYDDLFDFFIESQSDDLEQIIGSLPKISEKLEALSAVLPQKEPTLESLMEAFSLQRVLRIEIADLRVVSDHEAVATLSRSLSGPPSDNAPKSFRFLLTDDFWYFDNPGLAELARVLSGHAPHVAAIDQLIKGVQSGQDPAVFVSEQIGSIIKMLELVPGAANHGNHSVATDAGANQDRPGAVGGTSGGEATGD